MEVQIPAELEGRLADLAGDFTTEDARFVEDVDRGIAAADRGEFVDHLRVREMIDTWYPA